jgi:streptogramin lyase
MRSMLRSLLVSVLVAWGASALLVVPASALASTDAGQGVSGSPLGGSLVSPAVDELLRGEGARAARQARLASPVAIAQRSAARVRFERLTPTGAASVAGAAFPALAQPSGGTPSLPSGQRIVRYATNRAAEVSLANGARGLIESVAPLATTVGRRHMPLDLRLAEAGGGFAPVRSAIQVQIPRRLEDGGVSLPGVGVSLTPVDVHGAPLASSPGRLDGASVMWRQADRSGALDLASVAKASATGVDLSTLLLSQRSPGKLYFRLGLPAGAHLAPTATGGVQIFKGTALLATVAPVSAEDAEGTSVPAKMALDGHTLVVSLNLGGDYLYPIVVDPEIETNDSQLAETAGHKRSNWEFHTTSTAHFEKRVEAGVERLETKGISAYTGGEWAYWGYQTKGVSHIYEVKTQTSAHNKGNKIESYLEFLEAGGARETRKNLSNEYENPEYENKATTACAANASKVEECLPGSGRAGNAVVFEQAATAGPGGSYGFSDSMTQGIVSIAEPSGTHATTSYNTSSPTVEVEVEVEGRKEKVKRVNALLSGANTWLSKLSGAAGGAIGLKGSDAGIGVSATKLEYERTPGVWTPLEEHNYLAENGCQGVQCFASHEEAWKMEAGTLLPDGEQKLRYRAQEAISGTESLASEGEATVKVDTSKPHSLTINGLPYGDELGERPYELTVEATDGEGSTIASSGIKSIALFVDGHEFGTAGGSCKAEKGACTASRKWTVNGAELGAGKHDIEVVAFDNAGNEARSYVPITIRHSTPVPLGPGSVDLESGDFALGASDVSLGSGLTVGRNYSSRATSQGESGPLGPQWSLSLGSAESLSEMVDGSVLLTASNGSQTIFASLGKGKFESPTGDSNLEMTLEENEATQEKLAYYLKNAAVHTSVKFTKLPGSTLWVPSKQEGTVASDSLSFSYQLGKLVEYAVPNAARPQEIVTDSEGDLWISEGRESGHLTWMTPKGGVAELATGSAGVGGIATSPEGIWFTSNTGGELRLMSSGTVRVKKAAGCGCTLGAVTAAGNEVVYAANVSQNRIVEYNKGSVSETSLPAGSDPSSLVVAKPYSYVFVTNYGTSKITRINTSSHPVTVTEYALSPESHPDHITFGPNGNLWFITSPAGAKKLVEMTLFGSIVAEYPLPSGSEPKSLTVGPDGNLWYADAARNKLTKVTAWGAITELPVPSGSSPEGVTAGPEGHMWFTGALTKKVGAMPLVGPPVEPTEVLAPKPSGVSCEPEFKAGCRALIFKYATSTNGLEAHWGEFQTRLSEVLLKAYDPSSKTIKETAVDKYAYDEQGRLRAQWDPRISPNLQTTYGYDSEGHITALAPPGQEPWLFTYGTTAKDKGSGRLLKAMRAPASGELGKYTQARNKVAPVITGAPTPGIRLAASTGTWSGKPVPLTYGYQWERCRIPLWVCEAIPGATNANYQVQEQDLEAKLLVVVTATSIAGSATASSAETEPVGWAWYEWPSLPGHEPRGVVKGPDSAMWITEHGSNQIVRAVPTGPDAEYSLPVGSGPEEIASGPDGKLWYAENGTSKIGKITTTGTITEYALPAGSGPRGIAAGPDGNLWFTDAASSKIGKITTTGTITEYALPAGSEPWTIAAGPDGDLWFTDAASSKIGKITTTGTITEYALPAGSSPWGIAAGSDGNLWFTDRATGKVGKITTSGASVEYPLESSGAVEQPRPEAIAAGASGEAWYTGYAVYHGAEHDGRIGRLSISALAEGEVKAPEPGITLNYNVPISGAGAPYEMGSSEVARWGQSDDPDEATAITAADEPQSWPATSYKRAAIYYLDEEGREVNVATPSHATSGAISTTEYNEFNDVIRTLTPDNRLTALAAGAESAEKSKLLDTQSTYNGEGKKEGEVEEPGSRLVDVLGPQHMIKYRAGGEQKESLARHHEVLVYDQGAPGGEKYDLLTERYDLAQLVNHEEVEVRTTKTSYSGQGNLGWKLRAPTSVTVDPEGLKQTTTTEYEPTTGRITEVRGAGAETTLSYASKFGEGGSEAGKLKSPWGVAVNSEGKLLVVDAANNRIEKFGPEGAYISSFGEAGSGNGQLKEPEGIALDAAGHIWVADTGNNRVEEFSSSGAFMASVGSLGTESGKFKAPAALAFDSKGNMWVADSGNSRIEKFDKEAKYVSEFGSAGAEPGKLAEPKGIAVDSGEHVWVADTGNNRIQEFSTSGSLLKRFGTAGAGEGQLNTPIDLKIDSLGNIWTVDSHNSRVVSFTPNGAFVTQIGWKGTEAGQLTEPRSLAFDATGKAWVVDSSDNRLEQWSKGPNAHDQKTVYYSVGVNSEYPSCGSHPEWAGLVCETLPAKQPELMGLPKLPVTTFTYNMYNEPETITETFGSTTRTKKETYDAAGRKSSSEVTASSGVSLPKVNFTYNSELGVLEKQTTEGEGKTISSEFNDLGQQVKYTDADGNVAKYKYAGPERDLVLEEVSDSSASGTSKQTYEYDTTTMLRTKLVDSAAGSFTASYDAEANLTSVSYPYGMCSDYAYNAVGEATSVQYTKSSNCSESEPALWYSDSRSPSIRGEMLSQSSTLANETYLYDSLGRLTEAQETPSGEGCTVRAYAYDEEGSRASSSTRAPGVGGACQTEGGTIEAHNYDEGGRLADGGAAYDGLGNITKLPAADAEGKEMTSSFYVDNAVATQTQGGVTNEYKLDPEGRTREAVSGSVKTINHYDGAGETVAWSESPEKWVRNIAGVEGTLLATQTNGETPVLQLHDLQGDVVATIGDKAGEAKLLSSYNSTEFGVPRGGKAPPKFAWLGAAGVESSFSTGVITYGATSYVPQTGRALQSEQVEAPGHGGGSGLGAPYMMQEEPWVMQGAALSAAEAPGLEAAREQAAFDAALGAVVDPWEQKFYNLKEAEDKAEKYFEAESTAVVLSMFDLPSEFLELLGKVTGDAVSEFDDAYKWLYDAGEKLRKCARNNRGLHHCRFEWDEDEINPNIFGVQLGEPLRWPNFTVEPIVYECKFFSQGGHECPNEVYIDAEL